MKDKTYKNQQGVTLLLSVLILSGLILVTLTVAALTIQEIRASRAQVVSEPSINAAESGAEQALWALKRGGSVPDCSSPVSQNLSSSNTALIYCKSFAGENYNVDSQDTNLYLYDPNDPTGDVDLTGYPYSTLSITNNGAFGVSVNIYRIDDTNTPIISGLVNPDSVPVTFSLPAAAAMSEGRMQITLKTLSGSSSVFVTTDKGLPDIVNLDSSGCSSKSAVTGCTSTDQEIYTRKIRVNLK